MLTQSLIESSHPIGWDEIFESVWTVDEIWIFGMFNSCRGNTWSLLNRDEDCLFDRIDILELPGHVMRLTWSKKLKFLNLQQAYKPDWSDYQNLIPTHGMESWSEWKKLKELSLQELGIWGLPAFPTFPIAT